MTDNIEQESAAVLWGTKINNDKVRKEIEKKYPLFHKFMFNVLPLLLLFSLLGTVFWYYIIKTNPITDTIQNTAEEPQVQQRISSLYDGDTHDHIKKQEEIALMIQDWALSLEEDTSVLISDSNLIQVKWWTLPRYSRIDISQLPSMDQFLSSWYDHNTLINTIQNTLLSTKYAPIKEAISRSLLPINTIREYFSLDCLYWLKIDNHLCNKYVDIFLDRFYLYDLDNTSEELSNIYNKLDLQQKEKLCTNLLIYTDFSRSMNSDLERILKKCWKNYHNHYLDHKYFTLSNIALDKNIVSQRNIHNHISDLYLLLSMQQKIYTKLKKWYINADFITEYIDFVDNIMVKNTYKNIPNLYNIWTYYFNDKILKTTLEDLKYLNPTLQNDIDRVIPYLTKINEGNNSMGISWLKDTLAHYTVEDWKNNTITIHHQKELSSIERITNTLSNFSSFALIDAYYTNWSTENDVILEGYFIVYDNTEKYTLNTKLTIDPWSLNIRSIVIDNYETFSDILNKVLKRNNFSIPELHQYIGKNINFYSKKEEELRFCRTLKMTLAPLLNGKDTTKENTSWKDNTYDTYNNHTKNKISCTKEKVDILLHTIRYTITIDGLSITSIYVSDPKIHAMVNKLFLGSTTTEIDLISLIEDIITYKIDENKSEIFSWSTDVIIALDAIREYMNLFATNVVESGGIILAEIKVQDIPFIIQFDVENNLIKEVFFKWIKLNEEDFDLKVYNFNLHLSKENRRNINLFLIDPLRYIKSVNPRVYLQYLKYKRSTWKNTWWGKWKNNKKQ